MSKSSKQIIGSFVFRNEGDGCLTSKYHHRDSSEGPFTEACKLLRQESTDTLFLGTYQTVWLEDNNNHVAAILDISPHQNNQLFKLIWREAAKNGIIYFEGTGMLFDNFLTGAYWSPL